jgi:hypothetical protein
MTPEEPMIATGRTVAVALALLMALAAFLGGCSNSCSSEPIEPDDYLEPTSPENVLANLRTAYILRSVDEFLDCLSEDFRFYVTEEDVQDPGHDMPPWFYKADEQQIHENMFGDDWGVESITLWLTPTTVETIPGLDLDRPTDDVVVIRAEADVRLVVNEVTWLAINAQEFRLRVSEERTTDGRAEWELFEWHDTERNESGRVEDAGWGGIKFCFLEELSQQARRTSPTEVIEQLKTAYVAMDANSYLDCLSEDFIFYPTEEDVIDPNSNIPPEWYKTDELTIHTNMFDAGSDVSSISLDLTEVDIVHNAGDPTDPLDDTYEYRESVYLLVYLIHGVAYLADDPSIYQLRVDQEEEGPYGETMWEVYAWYDGPAGDREQTTWGGIKWLYR